MNEYRFWPHNWTCFKFTRLKDYVHHKLNWISMPKRLFSSWLSYYEEKSAFMLERTTSNTWCLWSYYSRVQFFMPDWHVLLLLFRVGDVERSESADKLSVPGQLASTLGVNNASSNSKLTRKFSLSPKVLRRKIIARLQPGSTDQSEKSQSTESEADDWLTARFRKVRNCCIHTYILYTPCPYQKEQRVEWKNHRPVCISKIQTYWLETLASMITSQTKQAHRRYNDNDIAWYAWIVFNVSIHRVEHETLEDVWCRLNFISMHKKPGHVSIEQNRVIRNATISINIRVRTHRACLFTDAIW